MVGISTGDTTLANLGWDEEAELRESRSRPGTGIVTFLHRAFNQRDELVAQCRRSGLQRKRTHVAGSPDGDRR